MTAGSLYLSSHASAQTVQMLVDFTSTWKYDASGTDLGTAWRTNTYDDTLWSSGMGLLGLEPDNPGNYPAPFNTPLTVPTPITFYFRIHFNFADATNGVTLIATNVVDDGCVMYLNGLEAARLRVPAGQNFMTSASGGPAAEGTNEVTTFPTGLLRQGDNVLAVEVHQSGTASSDVAWGTKLMAITPTMLSITTPPQSQTAAIGGSVDFTVAVSGGPVSYLWQKAPTGSSTYSTIAGAINATYTISNIVAGSAGNYRVIVSNAVNSVTSSPAALTVVSDVTPPTMLSAIVREVITGTGTNVATNFSQIDITFSEQLTSATASQLANYTLKRFETGATIPLQLAQYNNSMVRLTVNTNAPSNWFYRSNYYISVTGVTDINGNAIFPGSTIGVSWRIPLNFMQMSDEWSFYDLAFFNGTNIYSNLNWTQTNYVEGSGWTLASDPLNDGGIYWHDPNNQAVTCVGDSLATIINFQPDPTLFRRKFSVPTTITNATFRLRYMIDDGAVFYLNGQEIHRYNMPAGTVNYGIKAVTRIVDPTCTTNVAPINVNLFPGTNWFAVGVYQAPNDDSSDNGADTIFGLEIDGDYLMTSPAPAPPPPAPRLFITRSGGNAVITWTNTPGYALESSSTFGTTNLTGWTAVSGAANPYTTPIGNPPKYYRLKKP
jgi:hypothetical protein